MDDNDKNPFNKPKYSVRYEKTGVKEVDEYLKKAAVIKGKVAFANYVVDQAGVGNVDLVTSAGPILVAALTALPADGQALATDGQTLIGDLPKLLAGPDALKIPKIAKGLNGAIDNVTGAMKAAPETGKALTKVVANPGDVAAGATQPSE